MTCDRHPDAEIILVKDEEVCSECYYEQLKFLKEQASKEEGSILTAAICLAEDIKSVVRDKRDGYVSFEQAKSKILKCIKEIEKRLS